MNPTPVSLSRVPAAGPPGAPPGTRRPAWAPGADVAIDGRAADAGTRDPPTRRPGPAAASGGFQVVLNGAAGNQADEPVLQAIAAVLGAAGRPFELHRAARPERLAETARSAVAAAGDGGQVVAVGGDGTLNTVAAAVLGQPVTLGIVPRGTFNYMARAHGIPLDPLEAARVLVHGEAVAVTVGQVNGEPFLVNASVGLYPELLRDREAFKARHGRTRLVALGAALRTLLREHPRLDLEIQADGHAARTVRVSTLFIGNNALQLADLGLPEAQAVGDGPPQTGALAALALRAFRPGELLWLALRGALGQLGEARDLSHFAFRSLSVQPRGRPWRRGVEVAMDGEVRRLQGPLRFAVDERPLWLVKPRPDGADAGVAGAPGQAGRAADQAPGGAPTHPPGRA